MAKWYFPLSGNVTFRGYRDSGIETFRGDKIDSLTREIIQNSLDAIIPGKEQVRVEFKYFLLPTKQFPDYETFIENLDESIKYGKTMKNISTKQFFEQARNVFRQNYIPFLRISDFNTTGLCGSRSERGGDWFHLVRSSGASDKTGTTGGSFGIGKNAPFASSAFHTVFYSTLDCEGVTASQGIANLISVPKEGDFTQGYGLYSRNDRHEAFETEAKLDPSFERTESGTDIYIAAFSTSQIDYQNKVLASVLNNYLYAIYQETLVVKIDDTVVSRETLDTLIKLHESLLSKETIELIELLESPETIWHEDFFNNEASLGLLIDVKGSRRISAIRKPWMKIMYFDGFSRAVDFKGVFIAHGDELNKRLRALENPMHNAWETDRLPEEDRAAGKTLLTEIKRYISSKILSLQKVDESESLELIGAEDYIKLIDDYTKDKQAPVVEEVVNIVVRPANKLINVLEVIAEGEDDVIADEGDDGEIEKEVSITDKPRINGKKTKPVVELTGKKKRITHRNVKLVNTSNAGDYKIYFETIDPDEKVNIAFFALDEEGKRLDANLIVTQATQDDHPLTCKNNIIYDAKLIDGALTLTFKLNISEKISLGVNIHEANE